MALPIDPQTLEREATLNGTAEIAAYLQRTLGQKLTAYLAGLKDPKMVGQWTRGVPPRDTASFRLRYAYQAVRLIEGAFGATTAKAWLFGTNSYLHDEAPAYILRHARSPEDLRHLVPAARSFVGVMG